MIQDDEKIKKNIPIFMASLISDFKKKLIFFKHTLWSVWQHENSCFFFRYTGWKLYQYNQNVWTHYIYWVTSDLFSPPHKQLHIINNGFIQSFFVMGNEKNFLATLSLCMWSTLIVPIRLTKNFSVVKSPLLLMWNYI